MVNYLKHIINEETKEFKIHSQNQITIFRSNEKVLVRQVNGHFQTFN